MTLPAPDAPRHRAVIVRSAPVGAGLTLVVLEPDAALAATYTRAGQYVWVEPAGVPGGYFVLAGDPRGQPWELVIRGGGDAADWLLAAAPGTAVGVTAALGDGFDLPAAHGQAAAICVTAGAIAFARSIVRARIVDGDASRTELFLGVAEPGVVPLAEEVAAWRAAGVRAAVCLAEGAPSGPGEELGNAQDVLARRIAAGWRPTRVFMAGHPAMLEGLRALAAAEALVLDTNY